ncbi:hypothetical protein LMG24238_00493 [Paraburkholderia sediminicola]|uniref:Uncharacterized protein n=1 Tax=Paraburkholderia sediminicola TaxID=458836 RepID=A0A6J4ZUJ3_9BURK|nr:YbaB/EbfC family DNA-binding protein [Paraburkholderia sediminicola]CAB3643411.1 hypothetical protein LMG24238_00493 [Paraburkholderia sediminicola]
MTREPRKHRGLRALGAALFALLGAGAQAQSQPVPAAQAPQAWVAYAQGVGQQFQTALEGASAEAQRFHAFLELRAASDSEAGSAPPMLSVKVWLDASGHIVRVAFAPLGDQQADDDLRTLLLAQSAGVPPRGMRQPLVVRLHLSDSTVGEVRDGQFRQLGQPAQGTAPLAARRPDLHNSQE